MSDLSDKFKNARLASGMTLEEVAIGLGVSTKEIIDFETGISSPEPRHLNVITGLTNLANKAERTSEFTFIDLFAGIGGFHQALKNLGGKCVAACEIDELARTTYLKNHEVPEGKFYKNINHLNATDIPPHEVLCAGFPCQPFSISGKQKALNDKRSDVISSMFSIIEAKRPKIVILENVKHIKHVANGSVFEFIINELEHLNYNVSAKLLNAKDFGVPQNRERWLFIGIQNQDFHFRDPKTHSLPLKNFLDNSSTEKFTYLNEPFKLIDKPKKQKSGLIFSGYREKSIRKKGVREGTEHLSRVHKQPNRIYSIHGIHPTIPSQESSGRFWILLDNGNVRKLTIHECFRIMGFPDSFIKPVSLGNLYKQIGNSVCVPMIQQVMTWILEDVDLGKNQNVKNPIG